MLASLSVLIAGAAAVAAAGKKPTFTNPIIPGFHPDPSICRVGPDFYLVTSSFEYFPGIPIFHSRDLVSWRQIGHVLTERKQLDLTGVPASGGIFAATIRYAEGRFYVISTVVHAAAGGGHFYVTATNPQGPWSDPIRLDTDGVDPSLLFADGRVYYNRDGKGADYNHPKIYATTIDARTGKMSEPPRPIFAGTGGIWVEGAHLYKRGDRYYIMAAEGGTGYGHTEVTARSASPFGPFELYAQNPILSHRARFEHPIQATGHADLIDLDDGTTWAVFLGIRPHGGRYHLLGRETFLAPVRWTDDGWPIIGDRGAIELKMAAPSLPPQPFPPEPARDDFAEGRLAPAWNFVRNPDPRDWSLTERPGFLRLWGSPLTLDEIGSPALVGRRQQHFKVRCRALLEFAPRAAGEEAGLSVRATEDYRYDLAVRQGARGHGREAVLTRRVAGVSTVMKRVRLGDGPVQLEVAAHEDAYRFKVEAGGHARSLGTLPTRGLAAEEIQKDGRNYFTGAYVALYATGNGQRATAPADFDWFEYTPR